MVMRKVAQLNVRLPAELDSQLEEIAEYEHLDKVDVARQLLWEGAARRRMEIALREYAAERVSALRAAALAGVTLWEFLEEVARQGQRSPYSVAEVLADARAIAAATGLPAPPAREGQPS